SNDITWTSTYTPTADVEDATNVLTIGTGYTDTAGNAGAAGTSANYVIDGVDPTVSSVTVSDTTLLSGETATLTIVFSEAVAAFANADVTIESGAISTLASSDSITWTATLTPTADTEDATNTIAVAASYTDTAGNAGGTGTSANYIVETQAPSVSSVTVSDTALKAGDTATLTIVFSEAVAAFANEDVTIGSGAISTLASSDSITWTATLTPTADTEDAANTVDVAASYTDTAGNAGAAGASSNYAVDTLAPSVTITSSESNPATGSTLDVTITFSESVTGFVVGEAVVSGGSVSLSGSGATYTATITPTADGTITVDVAADVATDAAGNSNTVATQFSIVSDQNDAPAFTSTPVESATEDVAYSYTLTATDADDGDPNSNTITFTCTTGCSSGAWLSVSSGVLSGTPSDSEVGDYPVVLTASDGSGGSSTQSFTITTTNVNDAGSVAISGTVAEDSALTATVTDADNDGVSDTYVYAWKSSSDFITWTSIGTDSSTYTPTQTDVGKYIQVTASYTDDDGATESHSAIASGTVSNVNDNPTGSVTISGTATEDQVLTAANTLA
ncbi:uncharacterized protein METZ01_LOCUS201620, partial [marine metagenome]